MASLIIKDGSGTNQTVTSPDPTASGNPGLAIVESLPAGTNAIGSIRQLANTSTIPVTTTRGIKTVAAAATPEALVSTPTLVQKVLLIPQKAPRTPNASVVYVDFVSTDDTQATALSIDSTVVLASGSISFEAPAGKKIDLNAIYVDVTTAGDGVYYLAID